MKLNALDPFHSESGFGWDQHTVKYGRALPSSSALATTIIVECLIQQGGSPHNIASDQGTHLIAKEMWQQEHITTGSFGPMTEYIQKLLV